MRKIAVLILGALAGGCYDFAEASRREDPFERYANLPPPPGNLRVTVEHYEFEAADAAAFDLALRYRDNGVTLAGGSVYGPNGAIAFAGVRAFSAAFRAESRKFRSRDFRTFFLLVADGHEAELHVLTALPGTSTVVVPVYDGAVVIRRYEFIPVGTSLLVKPTKKGEVVDLEITPVISDRASGAVRITELSTHLTVEPGRPTVLMSHEERRDTFGAFFFSRRAGSTTRRVLQVVTVE
jgi:hypothetical protein